MYSHEQKRAAIQTIMDNTRSWLSSFGPGSKAPRPQMEVDIKSERLSILKEIKEDYESAIQRRGAA